MKNKGWEILCSVLSYIALFFVAIGFFAATNGDLCNYDRLDEIEWVEGAIESVTYGKTNGRDDLIIYSADTGRSYRYYIYGYELSKIARKYIGKEAKVGYMNRCFFDIQGVYVSCRYIFELELGGNVVFDRYTASDMFGNKKVYRCDVIVGMYWGAGISLLILLILLVIVAARRFYIK